MVQSAGDLWELLPDDAVLPRSNHSHSLQADEVSGHQPVVSDDAPHGATRLRDPKSIEKR